MRRRRGMRNGFCGRFAGPNCFWDFRTHGEICCSRAAEQGNALQSPVVSQRWLRGGSGALSREVGLDGEFLVFVLELVELVVEAVLG